jgi:hypothetical protein
MLANAWAAAALPPLEEAYSHAVAAESLEQQIAVQEQCFETADLKAANTCAGTDFGNRGEHAAALQGLRTELSSEERAARGIVAALMLEGVGEAAPPDKPIYYGRNTLVLAGIFLGFLVGAGLTLVLPLPSGTVR